MSQYKIIGGLDKNLLGSVKWISMTLGSEKDPGRFARFYAGVDTGILEFVSSINMVEKPFVRKLLSGIIRDIEIEGIPDSLAKSAVLVSNYPGVKESLKAVIKVGCELPGSQLRLLAIARKEVITESNPILGGFLKEAVLPAEKNEEGKYSMSHRSTVKALKHLEEGGVLWLSPTGNTEGNGLRMKDLRFGAVALALKTNVPIVPMGLITDKDNKVKRIKFGKNLVLSPIEKVSVFNQDEYLRLLSLLVLGEIAALLPPDQRGDFEDAEAKIKDIKNKLSSF